MQAKVSKGAQFTYYKALLELLGLRELDVYRYSRKGQVSDVIRVLEPASHKVVNVDLGTARESLSYEEFLNRVKESLERNGIKISDRVWSSAIYKVKSLESKVQAKAQPPGEPAK